jgi:serine/threonine-protein kinase
LATIVFAVSLVSWTIGAAHMTNVSRELGRFFTAIGDALFAGGVLWLLYLALEPYVRKFWPATVISWSRLLAGQVRDPLVGRDVLIGTLLALVMLTLGRIEVAIRPLFGYAVLPPQVPNVAVLDSTRRLLETIGQSLFSAAFNSLWIIFGMVAINLIVRRVWITAIVMLGFLMLTSASGIAEAPPIWLGIVFGVLEIGLMVFAMLRFGLLTTLTFFVVNFLLTSTVLTIDPSNWFFPGSTMTLLIVLALAIYGFYAARGGEPLLGKRILD